MSFQIEPLWKQQAATFTPCLVRYGKVFLGDHSNKLRAFDQETGNVVFEYSSPGFIASLPIERDGVLYFISNYSSPPPGNHPVGQLQAIDAASGIPLWTKNLSSWSWNSLALQFDIVMVGCEDGKLSGFSSRDGAFKWSRDVAGRFNSPFLVYQNMVIAAASGAQDVMAIDAHNGNILWTRRLDKKSIAGSVLDGGIYYVIAADDLNKNSILYVLNAATGELIGSKNYDLLSHELVVDETTIYVTQNKDPDQTAVKARIIALHKESLASKWEFECGFYPPGLPSLTADKLYLLMRDETMSIDNPKAILFGLDKFTGKEILRSVFIKGYPGWCAAIDDTVFAGYFYSIAKYNTRNRWEKSFQSPIRSTPAAADGRLIFGSQDGRLRVISTDSGDQQWAFPGDPSAIESSPVVSDNIVYFGTAGGNFLALRSEDGMELWRRHFPQAVNSSPAVFNDLILFGCRDRNLYALSRATGETRWSAATEGQIDGGVAMFSDKFVFGSGDGAMYAVDQAGARQWKFQTEGEIKSRPLITDDLVIFGNSDGRVFALHLSDGTPAWQTTVDGPMVYNSPLLHLLHFWIATEKGFVYRIKIADGSIEWKSSQFGKITSNPIWIGRNLYIADQSGKLHVLDFWTGAVIREIAIPAGVFTSIVSEGTSLYLADLDGNVTSIYI